MAKLPDVNELGRPNFAARRPIAQVDLSPIARAGEVMGDTIARAGQVMGGAITRGGVAVAQGEEAFGVGLGKGLQAFGEGAQKLGKGLDDYVFHVDQQDLARAKADKQIGEAGINQSFESDNDHTTFEQRYGEAITALNQSIEERLRPELQERFRLWSQPRDALAFGKARGRAFSIERDISLAADAEREQKLRESGLTDPDPIKRTEAIDTARSIIDAQYNRGFITAVQAQSRRQQWAVDFAKASIGMMPEDEQIRVLSGPPQAGSVTSFIPADDRERMLDRAQIRLMQREARADRLEDRQRKKLADEVLKEAYFRAGTGELTRDYIEASRGVLSATEYKGLLKLASGEEAAFDDPNAVAALAPRIDTDDPAEFQKNALDYLSRGKLKTTTFISLLEKNRAASRDDQPSSPYRSGRDLVKSTLDPGQMLSGAAASIARHGMAQALVEFDNWAQANPRATRADMTSEAQDIIRRYQVVDTSQMKLATGASRYFGVKSREEITPADIETAEKNLFADIESGRLTKAQQEFEIRLLETWRGILAREQRAREQERVRPKR